MNRAIQDKVEQVIAEKLIRGTLSPGQSVELVAGDLV
jgi:DNA-binding GntR family transcriptional regulator